MAKKQNYNVRKRIDDEKTELVVVEGEILESEELLDNKFFIHRQIDANAWVVSEYYTGMSVMLGVYRKKKELVNDFLDSFRKQAEKLGKEKWKEVIEKMIVDNVVIYGKANE